MNEKTLHITNWEEEREGERAGETKGGIRKSVKIGKGKEKKNNVNTLKQVAIPLIS